MMAHVLPANPETAGHLLEHLATWGEVTKTEVSGSECAETWLPHLCEAGVTSASPREGSPVSWSLTGHGRALLGMGPVDAWRAGLFQIRAYRRYLLGVLCEGLVLAAKADLLDRVDSWSRAELLGLLPEIHGLLDQLESADRRLVLLPEQEIREALAALPERALDVMAWDQALLGQSARPPELFEFVLRRFAPAATLLDPCGDPGLPAVLRPLPLNQSDGFTLHGSALPQPWNTRRTSIASGVALFDEKGDPLFDADAPIADVLQPAVQDALLDHPYYHAVVQLAIAGWRSPAARSPRVELASQDVRFERVEVLVGGRCSGDLGALLPELVVLQGFHAVGSAERATSPGLVSNLVRNLVAQEMLVVRDHMLVLHPSFQSSLVAARLRTVFRPGKAFGQRMIEWLEARADDGLEGDDV